MVTQIINGQVGGPLPRLFDICCENRLKRLIKTHRIIRTIDLFKEFNMNNPRPFSKRCILYHVKRLGFKRRAQRSYLVVKDINRKKRRKWARARLRWPAEAWSTSLVMSAR